MDEDLIEQLRTRHIKLGFSEVQESLFSAAAEEIERLRAGGCARDQTTTQFCAEAVALQGENARLREALEEVAAAVGDPSAYYIARSALAEKECK